MPILSLWRNRRTTLTLEEGVIYSGTVETVYRSPINRESGRGYYFITDDNKAIRITMRGKNRVVAIGKYGLVKRLS